MSDGLSTLTEQGYDEFKVRLLALLIEIRDELQLIDSRLIAIEEAQVKQ